MRVRIYLVWGKIQPGSDAESLIAARLTRALADEIADAMTPKGRVDIVYATKEEGLGKGEGAKVAEIAGLRR